MEQDRYEEYKKSIEDAGAYPESLDYMAVRLKERIRDRQRKIFMRGTATFVGLSLLFILIVNTPTAMADVIFDIPVIGTIADYVCFDKGLQSAINNEYAQEVDLTEESKGYSLSIPYVIADSKRLVVFFQLPKNLISNTNEHYQIDITKIVDTSTGAEYSDYCSESSWYNPDDSSNKGIHYINIRTIDTIIPQKLKLYVTLSKENATDTVNTRTSTDVFDLEPNLYEPLGSFEFDLQLNDYSEPKVINLNQDITIMGQSLHLNSVTEYPTGIEISVTIPTSNTSIINDLDFKAIDRNGNEWGNPNGISAIGYGTSHASLYYLESDYFDSLPIEALQITGIRLIKKSEEKITVDLLNKTTSPKIPNLYISSIEHKGNKANITFESASTECLSNFNMEYQDMQGNKYQIESESSSTTPTKVQNYLSVVWPEDNKVILTRAMSPIIELEKPVEINLKN